MLKADTARIIWAGDTLFLVIGWNRNTRDLPGTRWDGQGERIDWDYVEEATVANGRTVRELMDSARHYQRLSGMTMLDYLRELFPDNQHLRKAAPLASA